MKTLPKNSHTVKVHSSISGAHMNAQRSSMYAAGVARNNRAVLLALLLCTLAMPISCSEAQSAPFSVSAAIGLGGLEKAHDMVDLDILHEGVLEAGAEHSSLNTSMITLIVKGGETLPSNSYIQLDALATMHFLDDQKFFEVLDLIDTADGDEGDDNLAYSAHVDPATDHVSLGFSALATAICTGGKPASYSCGIRTSVVDGTIVDPSGVASLYDGNGTGALLAETYGEEITKHSGEIAKHVADAVRSRYQLDGRIHNAYLINPAFRWPAPRQSGGKGCLALGSKLVVILAVSARDRETGGVKSRRLLTLAPEFGGQEDINAPNAAMAETTFASNQGDQENIDAPDTAPDAAMAESTPEPDSDDREEMNAQNGTVMEETLHLEVDVAEKDNVVSIIQDLENDIANAAAAAVKKMVETGARKLLGIDSGPFVDVGYVTNLAFKFDVDLSETYREILSIPKEHAVQIVNFPIAVGSNASLISKDPVSSSVAETFGARVGKAARDICPLCTTFQVVSVTVPFNPVIEPNVIVTVAMAGPAAIEWSAEKVRELFSPRSATEELVTTTRTVRAFSTQVLVDCNGGAQNCPAGCSKYDHDWTMRTIAGSIWGTLSAITILAWVGLIMDVNPRSNKVVAETTRSGYAPVAQAAKKELRFFIEEP